MPVPLHLPYPLPVPPAALLIALACAVALVVVVRVRTAPYRLPRDRQWRKRSPRSYRLRAEAERRAEQLLRDVLTDAEYQQFVRRGYLEVRSPTFPSRTYLVPERQGPVTVCEYGRPIMRLCVQCVDRVPDHDTVAMHKLMIDGNEQEYLRLANRV